MGTGAHTMYMYFSIIAHVQPSGRPDIATLLALVESMMRRLHKREQRPPESDRAGKEEQAKCSSSCLCHAPL